MSKAFHHTPLHTSANRLFVQYGPNQKGRDFAVGDIHGEFSLLERLLERPATTSKPTGYFPWAIWWTGA
ncbi:hypothetical protein ACE0DR_22350 [Azotobacter sp. CWF10]